MKDIGLRLVHRHILGLACYELWCSEVKPGAFSRLLFVYGGVIAAWNPDDTCLYHLSGSNSERVREWAEVLRNENLEVVFREDSPGISVEKMQSIARAYLAAPAGIDWIDWTKP